MKKYNILLLVFLAHFSPLLHAHFCDSIGSIEWLLGDWVAETGDKILTESWQTISPLTIEGRGETRSSSTNVLLASESLRLVEMTEKVFYFAKVEHNNLPVAFKLTQCSDTHAVFENASHDFPKKLEYRFDLKNKLTVIVSDGKEAAFEVNFHRQKAD